MLLIFMYHRISHTSYVDDVQRFTQHIEELVQQYPIVVPGDLPSRGKLSICLTFDDAYYDFYHYVYPMLRKLNIKALLAIPVNYIVDTTDIDATSRLAVDVTTAMQDKVFETQVPFCTWEEINEMVASGHVIPTCHSFNHSDLSQKECDLKQEVVHAKSILETKLKQAVSTFIYPYGKMTRATHRYVRQHFRYAMRIGSALNRNWGGERGLLYRVDADRFWPHQKAWTARDQKKYFYKYLSNQVRFK